MKTTNCLTVLFVLLNVTFGRTQEICGTWPSPAEVQKLGDQLEGPLFFPGSEVYYLSASMAYPNFYRLPGIIVSPNHQEDVQKAVIFAKDHNLPISIKSSGHDFNGRSTGDDTLMLNMYNMNYIKISPDNTTANIGPSCHWGQVYEEVNKVNKVAVGGSSISVCPGGYLAGGGHSPMSPLLGLGVDSVESVSIVAMDGSLVKAYPDKLEITHPNGTYEEVADADLFWALRGGGGGTYGVVTEYEIKLHDPPQGFTQLQLTYVIEHSDFGYVGDQVIDHYAQEMLANLSDAKWGGYVITSNNIFPINDTDGEEKLISGTIAFSLLFPGSYEDAVRTSEAFYNFHPEWTLQRQMRNFSTFWDYTQDNMDPIGYRTWIMNRLFQRSDYEDTTGWKQMIRETFNVPVSMGCTGATMGGQASQPSDESASISPDLRSSWLSVSCGAGYGEEWLDDYYFNIIHDFYNEVKDLVGKGVYLNEPTYELPNWKEDLWGSLERYNLLLDIKKKWDPQGLLYCHHCVGSED